MLTSEGFDLWADGYDADVGLTEALDRYPFAGCKAILNEIYNRVLARTYAAAVPCVLDLGFGTGTLTAKLYEQGCRIYGQDFSPRMTELARERVPRAELYQGELNNGLVEDLAVRSYDAIVATYSLHHLTDERKVSLLRELTALLSPGGRVYIGDVAFDTRQDLERCREENGAAWDDDEIYFVVDELREPFTTLTFTRFSNCAGLIELGGEREAAR